MNNFTFLMQIFGDILGWGVRGCQVCTYNLNYPSAILFIPVYSKKTQNA